MSASHGVGPNGRLFYIRIVFIKKESLPFEKLVDIFHS